jgi:hypothetical protein
MKYKVAISTRRIRNSFSSARCYPLNRIINALANDALFNHRDSDLLADLTLYGGIVLIYQKYDWSLNEAK